MTNQVTIRTSVKDDASKPLSSIHDAWKKFQADGAKGVAIGASAAITAKGIGLVEQGAERLGAAIGDVIKAGIDEEASMSRLRTSLAANVPGWNGNTDAILATIKAHVALGFTEDEQRNSLTQLVAATHDVNKAFAVQAVAMDLARFKHISLADASDALTKVEAGSYRILKSLGIELPKHATQVEALAAVEKIAAGQAADFAQTTEGKLVVAQAKLGSVMEDLGVRVLPLVSTGADIVVAALDNVVPVVDGVVGAVNNLSGVLDTLSGATKDSAKVQTDWLGDNVTPLGRGIHGLAEDIGAMTHDTLTWIGVIPDLSNVVTHAGKDIDDLGHITSTTDSIVGKAADDMGGRIANVGDAATTAAAETKKATDQMIAAFLNVKNAMLTDAQQTVTGYYDVLITQDKLAANNAEITKNERILASSTATAQQKHDAQVALHQLGADQAQYLQDLAKGGATGSAIFTKNMAALLARLKTAHGAERAEINAEIIALELLSAKAYDAAQKVKTAANGGNLPSYGGHRATGGPVDKGVPYIVGEHHAELFVPAENGQIIPDVPTMPRTPSGGGSGGTGGITVNIPTTILGIPSPAQIQQWARDAAPALARELRRQRLIPA